MSWHHFACLGCCPPYDGDTVLLRVGLLQSRLFVPPFGSVSCMFALYLVSLHCHGDSHSQGLNRLCLSEQLEVSLASSPLSDSLSLRVLWNTVQALILSAAQPSELRAWRLHSHRHRITWSMRTLAAFAAAAATEDRKGVLHSPSQPDCPDLATIIAILLSAKQVLQVG
jgi:hypothetical protein